MPQKNLTLYFGSIFIVLSDDVLLFAHHFLDNAADWLDIFNSQSGSPKSLVLKWSTESPPSERAIKTELENCVR